MDRQALLDLVATQERGELSADYRLIESTLGPHPVLEAPFLGVKLEGLPAWRKWYEDLFASGFGPMEIVHLGRFADPESGVVVSEDLTRMTVRDRYLGMPIQGERQLEQHTVILFFFEKDRGARGSRPLRRGNRDPDERRAGPLRLPAAHGESHGERRDRRRGRAHPGG